MKNRRILIKILLQPTLFGFCLFLASGAISQTKDTLVIMHYNLLNYGNVTTYCTANNNSVNNKDEYLKTITNYVKPDIFTINEIGCNNVYARRIKNLVLNADSGSYEQTTLMRSGNQSICNMLFYNTEKVIVSNHEIITKAENGSSIVRAIDLYELKFLSTNLPENTFQTDTPATQLLTMHLKAGSGSSNKVQREAAAAGVMDYLETNKNPGNYLLTGDLNLYTNTEGAWQNFTDWSAPSFNFIDPINRAGSWNNNSSYSDVHTQSTRTSGGCFSGGGMDDRFDFILASQYLLNGRNSVQYIPGTYKALGQDGKRFNGRLNSPTNNSAPPKVIEALYNMSDHLPIIMQVEFIVGQAPNSVVTGSKPVGFKVWVNSERKLVVQSNDKTVNGKLELLDLSGKLIQKDVFYGEGSFSLSDTKSGVYVVRITDEQSGHVFHEKIMLN